MTEEEQTARTAFLQRLAFASLRLEEASARLWVAKHRDKVPPSERELLLLSDYLISRPHQMFEEHRWDWYIYLALKNFTDKTPLRPHTSKEVAELVDRFVRDGMPLADARKEAASFVRKSPEAVKQAHLRHGRTKRDKMR